MSVLWRPYDRHRNLRARQRRPRAAILRLREQHQGRHDREPPTTAAPAPPEEDLTSGRMTAACAGAHQHELYRSPRRNRTACNDHAAPYAARATRARSSTSSLPSVSRISSAAADQAENVKSPSTPSRDLHPAGSSPGGFRTPASVPGQHVAGRHPGHLSHELTSSRVAERVSFQCRAVVPRKERGGYYPRLSSGRGESEARTRITPLVVFFVVSCPPTEGALSPWSSQRNHLGFIGARILHDSIA